MSTVPLLAVRNWKNYNNVIVVAIIVLSFLGGMVVTQFYRDFWQPLKFVADEIYYVPPGTLIYFGKDMEAKEAIKIKREGVFHFPFHLTKGDDANVLVTIGQMLLNFEVMLLPGDEDYCFHLQGMPQSPITEGYMDEFCATIKDDAMIYDSPPI